MIKPRFKKVLLVAPEIYSQKLTAGYKSVKHVYAVANVFPTIYSDSPDLIILDLNYIGKDTEKIVRRLRTNSFYSKIKVCCFKLKAEPRADSLLKAIGVDYFIYQDELQALQKDKNVLSLFSGTLDRAAVGVLSSSAN